MSEGAAPDFMILDDLEAEDVANWPLKRPLGVSELPAEKQDEVLAALAAKLARVEAGEQPPKEADEDEAPEVEEAEPSPPSK